MLYTQIVERWAKFEWKIPINTPLQLTDRTGLKVTFNHTGRYFETEGYYDGSGAITVRFMPDQVGEWAFQAEGAMFPTGIFSGKFQCVASSQKQHGRVQIMNQTRFTYEDGTTFIPMGTWLEEWHVQEEARRLQTIETLQASPFNKVNMLVMPYRSEAVTQQGYFPFVSTAEGKYDGNQLHLPYFDLLDKSIARLAELGIQVELVLFSPKVEQLGLIHLTEEQKHHYIRYIVARYAAYANVWWTISDNGDQVIDDTEQQLLPLIRTIKENDYGHHLLTVHGVTNAYNWGLPTLTHISLKDEDIKKASDFTLQYEKPVVLEHCGREGNGATPDDALLAEEMTYHIWEAIMRGGFASHGESMLQADGTTWSVHGGLLVGDSIARLTFLQKIISEAPHDVSYSRLRHDASTLEERGHYYLQYFGPHRFSSRAFMMPEGKYEVDIIDTWNMTITTLEQAFEGRFDITLLGELYYALRLRKVGTGQLQGDVQQMVMQDVDQVD
ncbi:DUF5605 domain-containing protein [Paenibacillus yanchengensis]|uniref:DUF5605 domain-containing protein n=1 Tax=Paenibacillus yanchengensis TaxID=2035833 RepID=A0ABW4YH24_9BACL